MTRDGRADQVAPPAAVRVKPTVVDFIRAARARRRRGVSLLGRPRLGRGVRLEAASGARIAIDEGCVIGDGCRVLARGGEVRMGAGVTLGERCTLVAHVGIAVGTGAVLGERAMVVDFDLGTSEVERAIRLQPIAAAPVTVGARARIGHGASLLQGVTVGPGAVVGSHAVVTRDVAPGERVGGVPARPVARSAHP